MNEAQKQEVLCYVCECFDLKREGRHGAASAVERYIDKLLMPFGYNFYITGKEFVMYDETGKTVLTETNE